MLPRKRDELAAFECAALRADQHVFVVQFHLCVDAHHREDCLHVRSSEVAVWWR